MKKRNCSFFDHRKEIPEPESEPENSVEGIYPLLDEFMNSIEGDPVLGNMDVNMPKKINDDKDKSDQKVQEMEESLGLVMQAIRDMDAMIQAMTINQVMLEVKKAPILLKEDNLTKAKRALMTPKQLCPSGYNGVSKQGQAWCANVCYHSIDFKVETILAEDIKFTIYRAIETNLRTRVLHLEPGTIEFNSFTPAEYLEEMLGMVYEFKDKRRGEARVQAEEARG